jgi:hypothetical protein
MADQFYLRYYSGHVGAYGHEFIEFEITGNRLRFALGLSWCILFGAVGDERGKAAGRLSGRVGVGGGENYSGHVGAYGHEFIEFEITGNRLRFALNSKSVCTLHSGLTGRPWLQFLVSRGVSCSGPLATRGERPLVACQAESGSPLLLGSRRRLRPRVYRV